jgi:4-alpha-glucanotransferase
VVRNRRQHHDDPGSRSSGILLHVTSLPSSGGIGDFGPWAYRFADFLAQAGQRYWQILPLTAADYRYGCSPYNCMSAFAGNKYLVSPDMMVRSGFLRHSDLRHAPHFANHIVEFPKVVQFKEHLFARAYARFADARHGAGFARFCRENAAWLEDYALFVALKDHYKEVMWYKWPAPVKNRDAQVLRVLRKSLKPMVEREKFLQYIFAQQWGDLKGYCNAKGIEIIGDVPIYVDSNSVDVWVHPEIFKLDRNGNPVCVSGVPPDYFSSDGQLWGNPVYRWNVLRKNGYKWWIARMGHNIHLFDHVRMDHFRGFVAYWQVPAGAKTARDGRWVRVPAAHFLRALSGKYGNLPIIAEDLGTITPDVHAVMRQFGLPGMRILLFAFGDGRADHPYLPHNYVKNCVVYTGTHDNNTVRGWFEHEASPSEKKMLHAYLGKKATVSSVHNDLMRLAMMSVADRVIIPMQDVVGLGGEARMNRPASVGGNWQWRLRIRYLNASVAERLRTMTRLYGRA